MERMSQITHRINHKNSNNNNKSMLRSPQIMIQVTQKNKIKNNKTATVKA